MPYGIRTIRNNNKVYLEALDLDTGCKYGPIEIFVGLSRTIIDANINTPAVFESATNMRVYLNHPLYDAALELPLLEQTADQQRLNLLQNNFEDFVKEMKSKIGDLVLENQVKDAKIEQLELEIQRKQMESGFVKVVIDGQSEHSFFFGTRTCRRSVTFQKQFVSAPKIALSLKMIDSHQRRGLSISTKTENVTQNGFDIVCTTSHDAINENVEVTWIAYQD